MLGAMKAALVAVIDTNLKLLRRRRDARAVASSITHLRDDVLAHEGPPELLSRFTCERIERLVSSNGVERDRPMAQYWARKLHFEDVLENFLNKHPHPTTTEWQAFVLKQAGGQRLAPRDVDCIIDARKRSTKALRLVYHLDGAAEMYPSFEEFSRSVRRAQPK